jgi:hypothetical protein
VCTEVHYTDAPAVRSLEIRSCTPASATPPESARPLCRTGLPVLSPQARFAWTKWTKLTPFCHIACRICSRILESPRLRTGQATEHDCPNGSRAQGGSLKKLLSAPCGTPGKRDKTLPVHHRHLLNPILPKPSVLAVVFLGIFGVPRQIGKSATRRGLQVKTPKSVFMVPFRKTRSYRLH